MLSCAISKNKEDLPVFKRVCEIFTLIGRFCDYASYFPIAASGLKVSYLINFLYNFFNNN